jgi:predicted RNA-binding protein
MCLSKAYIEKNGDRQLLLEEVAAVTFDNDKLTLRTLFGEQKEVRAGIKEIDFMTHNIILKELK